MTHLIDEIFLCQLLPLIDEKIEIEVAGRDGALCPMRLLNVAIPTKVTSLVTFVRIWNVVVHTCKASV